MTFLTTYAAIAASEVFDLPKRAYTDMPQEGTGCRNYHWTLNKPTSLDILQGNASSSQCAGVKLSVASRHVQGLELGLMKLLECSRPVSWSCSCLPGHTKQ